VSVGADASKPGRLKTATLDIAGTADAAGDIRAPFSRHRPDEIDSGNGEHIDADVDTIHQRT